MWQMIGVLAELERSLMTERTRAGVKAARQRGVQFGPKPQQQFSFWLRQGFEIANGHLLGLRWYPLEPRRQDDASLTLR